MKKLPRSLSLSEPKGKVINEIRGIVLNLFNSACVEHVNMYCHTCAERSFAGMTITQRQTERKQKKRSTNNNLNSKTQNQHYCKERQKIKKNFKKDASEAKSCTGNLLQTFNKRNTVKRSQVRVRSAKGKINVKVANAQQKLKKNKKEERKQIKDKKSNLNIKSCHNSFTNFHLST